jgi:hypothetical protein
MTYANDVTGLQNPEAADWMAEENPKAFALADSRS